MSPGYRISMGANIVLMGIVAALLWPRQPAVSPSAGSAVPPPSPAMDERAIPGSDTRTAARALPPQSTGSKLTPAAIAALEQMGISRDTLINVLLEDFNHRSTEQVVALKRRYAPRLVPDRELVEFARANEAERIRELKEAFGEDGYRAWDKEQVLHSLNRARPPGDELPMSAAEAEQAYRLQKEFDEQSGELQRAIEDGVADRADAGALQAQAQQVLDQGLEQLLGRERFDALRGNVDPATDVYRRYGDLNPTPGQAHAVLQADQDYRANEAALAQTLQETPGDAATVMAELKALDDAHQQNLRGIFGAAAYDDLQRQNDPAYRALTQFAGTWDLADNEVQSVYETLHAFNDRADRTRAAAEMREAAGQRVNWREINAGIEQARQEAEAGLQTLIGRKRLWRLKENGMLSMR